MMSDAALATAARDGDRDAFDQLYRRYRPGLMGFVQRQVGDHHLAEDIVQECFLVAWRDLAKLRDPASVKTWLFSIGYRQAMRHAGRPILMPLLEATDLVDDDPAVRPEQVAEQREAQALVWSAAMGLEPRQRAVLELAVRGELSSKEIGDVLGVGRAHAAVLVHRARSALSNAINAMLLVRQRDRCRGLERLLGGTHRELSARQRSSVDHHVRRCVDCARFRAFVLSPAVPALLFGKVDVTVRSGGILLKLSAAALVVAATAGAVALTVDEPKPAIVAEAVSTEQTPTSVPSPTPSPEEQLSPSPSPSPAKLSPEAQMVVLINQRRAEAGCNPVTSNDKLAEAARKHSADMAQQKYFSHTSLDGSSPWDRAKRAGYQWPSAENIAAGNSGAAATMEQLMNSPGHRANILNCSHKAVGIGRAAGGPYRYYWTQLFGSR